MSEEHRELRIKDIEEELVKVMAHGFGRVVIEVADHHIKQIETSTRRRQTSRAGNHPAQTLT